MNAISGAGLPAGAVCGRYPFWGTKADAEAPTLTPMTAPTGVALTTVCLVLGAPHAATADEPPVATAPAPRRQPAGSTRDRSHPDASPPPGVRAKTAGGRLPTAGGKTDASPRPREPLASPVIQFGFSVGPRFFVTNDVQGRVTNAAIEPASGNLRLENNDDNVDMAASMVVAAFPFAFAPDLGAVVNINFAKFGPESGALSVFNQTVEGGAGIAYRFGKYFALALTYERATIRVPHCGVEEGKKVPGGRTEDGEMFYLESISIQDDRYFKNEGVSVISPKFIFFL